MIKSEKISPIKADESTGRAHNPSQTYLSTRGGDYGVIISTCSAFQKSANDSQLSFETVVLKGLAADGGLFLPEEIPQLPNWVCTFDGQQFA